jgi:hypothetical protein
VRVEYVNQLQQVIQIRSRMFLMRIGRAERFLGIDFETPPLHRRHDDSGKARRPSAGIALAPADMAASWQVRRIRAGQQSGERIERHSIDGLHSRNALRRLGSRPSAHGLSTFHAPRMTRGRATDVCPNEQTLLGTCLSNVNTLLASWLRRQKMYKYPRNQTKLRAQRAY